MSISAKISRIVNISGKGDVVKSMTQPKDNQLSIDLSDQEEGIYYFEFITDDKKLLRK